MSDLFTEHLQALRAQSLHRTLREIGTAQGPKIEIGVETLRRLRPELTASA